jgi:hypothetical protein
MTVTVFIRSRRRLVGNSPRRHLRTNIPVDGHFNPVVRITCSFYGCSGARAPRDGANKRRQIMAKSPRSRSAQTKPAHSCVYQIKVTLSGSEPPIWRRLLVSSSTSLAELHRILQVAMGWTDDHLHGFEPAQRRLRGRPEPADDLDFDDEERVRLDQALPREKSALVYMYDFGDSWAHDIVVEKVLPSSDGVNVPSCIGGERACPPEDCGGIWGYDDLLDAIRDPEHPEHEEKLEWVGDEFDPERFDADAVNAILAPRRRTRAA